MSPSKWYFAVYFRNSSTKGIEHTFRLSSIKNRELSDKTLLRIGYIYSR